MCILGVNLVFFPLCVLSSILMSRRGTFLWALYSGWVFQTLGSGLLLLCTAATPVAGAVFIYIVAAAGQRQLLVALNLATQSIAAAEDEDFMAKMHAMPDGSVEKKKYLAVYIGAFHGVYCMLLALAALCLVLTFAISHHNMDKKLESGYKLQERGEKTEHSEAAVAEAPASAV